MANSFDWDSPVSDNGNTRVLLPEGYYNFKVTSLEKQRFNGSAKISECPMAHITVAIKTNDGTTVSIPFNLLLSESVRWKVTSFFICIGLMKPGEQNKILPWEDIEGARGRAHVTQRSYEVEKNGTRETRTVNDIDRFIAYDPKFFDGVPADLKEDDDDGDIPF